MIKMFKNWEIAGYSMPEINNNISSYTFKLTLPLNREKDNKVGDKVGENLTDNQQQIITLLEKNPKLSAKLISVKIGISSRKVEENIQKLKRKNLIKRIGSAKGGYWVVNKIVHNR